MTVRKVEPAKSPISGPNSLPPPSASPPGSGAPEEAARETGRALKAPAAPLRQSKDPAILPDPWTEPSAPRADGKERFFQTQGESRTITREVSSGLARPTQVVADAHSAEKRRAASDTRLGNQRAILDGKAGVVDRPIGGSKGAAYDAAQVLASHIATHAEAKLDGQLSVEAKAAKDVLREPIVRTGKQIMAEAVKNPDTLRALGDVAHSLGTPGFTEALGAAASQVGKHVVDATQLTAVNVEAVQATVAGVTAGTDRLVKAAAALKNPALESAVATQAPKVARSVAQLGAKLTQGAVRATAAAGAAGATHTATVATAASTAAGVAGASASTAGAAASAGAQAVPVVGQALGVAATGLAACEFVAVCRDSPRAWTRIAAAGANVVGQAAGIFLPFVGLASSGLKLAADAALDARDRKLGLDVLDRPGLDAVAPFVGDASALASSFFDGAGHSEVAAKLRAYAGNVQAVANSGVRSTDFAQMSNAERDALFQTLSACSAEVDALAAESQGTPQGAAALLLGEAYRGLAVAWRKSKNMERSDNPEMEQRKLEGEAMEAAARASAAQAVIAHAEASASAPSLPKHAIQT